MKEVDIEAEKEILRELHIKMLADHNTDVDEEMSYMAEDTILIPPDMPAIIGYNAIKLALEQMVQTKVLSLGDRTHGPDKTEVAASGDLAWDVGRFIIVTEGPEGPIEQKGHYITIYKKIDDQWKFMGQSWNNVNLARPE